jgi:hypothetical protein
MLTWKPSGALRPEFTAGEVTLHGMLYDVPSTANFPPVIEKEQFQYWKKRETLDPLNIGIDHYQNFIVCINLKQPVLSHSLSVSQLHLQ